MKNKKNNQRIWPLVVACGALYATNLGIGAYLRNQIVNDKSDPYKKTMSADAAYGYVQKDLIDIDRDGTPDITRTLIAVPGGATKLTEKCTPEEIEWFKGE